MAKDSQETKWLVIHCPKDDSHSLVSLDQVVCDPESVAVGDEVNFNLRSKIHSGVVRSIGDEYETMKETMMLLNKAKKVESFHEDRPRKAALLSRANIQSAIALMKNKRPGETSADNMSKKKKATKNLNKEDMCLIKASKRHVDPLSDDSDTGSAMAKVQEPEETITDKDDDAASDESSSSLTDLEKKVLEKALAKKKRAEDVKALLSMNIISAGASNGQGSSKTTTNSPGSPPNSPGSPTPPKPVRERGKKDVLEDFSGKDDSDSSNKSSCSEPEKKTFECLKVFKQKKPKTWKKQHLQPTELPSFTGKMLMYSAKDKDKGIVELADSGVFVNEGDFNFVKSNTSTATALARRLLNLVFTKEARLACSVGGNAATGKGRQSVAFRPALNADAVLAILEFTTHRAKKKKWTVPTHADLRSKMAAKLCEDRAEAERAKKSEGS